MKTNMYDELAGKSFQSSQHDLKCYVIDDEWKQDRPGMGIFVKVT